MRTCRDYIFFWALMLISGMEIMFSRFGLSRERVRQVGLVAMEKLKHAARRKHLNVLLEDY